MMGMMTSRVELPLFGQLEGPLKIYEITCRQTTRSLVGNKPTSIDFAIVVYDSALDTVRSRAKKHA